MAVYQQLQPDEEQSLLQRLGAPILGGLGYIGQTLDKFTGARALRGLLGGKPNELLSLVPGSDVLGLTNPADTVHGTELLGFGKDTDLLSPEGVAGLAAEMLLMPIPSFGSHALTRLGSQAQKLGVLPRNIGANSAEAIAEAASAGARRARIQGITPEAATFAETFKLPQAAVDPVALAKSAAESSRIAGLAPGQQADALAKALSVPVSEVVGQRLGGHMGLRLPFMSEPWTFDLSGVGGALAKLGAGSYNPLGYIASKGSEWAGKLNEKVLRPLFGSKYMGQTTAYGQDLAENVTRRIGQLEKEGDAILNPIRQTLSDQALTGLAPEQFGSKLHRQAAYDIGDKARLALESGVADSQAVAGIADPLEEALARRLAAEQATGRGAELGKQAIAGGPEAERLGVVGQELGFAPRRTTNVERGMGQPSRESFKTPSGKARQESLENLLTADINALREANLSGDVNSLRKQIGERWLGLDDAAIQRGKQAREQLKQLEIAGAAEDVMAPVRKEVERFEQLSAQALDLAKMKHAGTLPKFANNLLDDVATSFKESIQRQGKGEGILDGIMKSAKPIDQVADGVSVAKVLHEAGLDKLPGGQNTIISWLQDAGHAVAEAKDLKNFAIPVSEANTLLSFVQTGTSAPTWMKPVIGAIDAFTSLWKTAATVLWPAHHMRNQFQAITQNVFHGGFDPLVSGPGKWTRPWTTAKEVIEGGRLHPDQAKALYGAGVSLDEATTLFNRERMLDNAGNISGRQAIELAGGGSAGQDFLSHIPGPRRGLTELAGQAIDPELYREAGVAGSIYGIQGVGRFEKTVQPWAKAGRDVQAHLEEINNTSMYLAKRLQGYSREQAVASARAAHYDFSNLTAFEREGLKRVVPFYSWSKASLPATAAELATNPAGPMGKTLQAVGRGASQYPGFLPDYLQDAVPVGLQDDKGNQRLLSQFGFGFEDLPKLLSHPGREILGSLNPALKMPIEMATGRQVFSGRDIRDINLPALTAIGAQPPTWMEMALMNSPLSRVASMLGTVSDPRKGAGAAGLNLLTGLRMQDLNIPQAEASGLRAAIQDIMRSNEGARMFETLYVPKEMQANLSPEGQRMMSLYQMLEQRRRRGLAGVP